MVGLKQVVFQIRSGKIPIVSNLVGRRKYYVLLSLKEFPDIGLGAEPSDKAEVSADSNALYALDVLYATSILADKTREWFRDPANFETLYYVLEDWERVWLGELGQPFPKYTVFKWELEAIINNGRSGR